MKKIGLFIVIALQALTSSVSASKLVSASILDKDYIMLYFRDGDVTFTEAGSSSCPLYNSCASANSYTAYGSALNTANVSTVNGWKISSTDDPNFGTGGYLPVSVYRKSKLGCMAQMAWSTSANDYNYSWGYEHTIFLKLPKSMTAGKSYTITIPANINPFCSPSNQKSL